MVEQSSERIRIWHPDGHEHQLTVLFHSGPLQAVIGAMYEEGCSNIEAGSQVVCWSATYEPPAEYYEGQLCLGNGRIDLDIDILRGIGIGSLLMLPLVRWAKSRSGDVPVVPINLAGPDAETEGERDRRNKFYEKLGFVFNYADQDRTFGVAREMLVSKLITPAFKMSGAWKVESVSGTGNVF